MGLVKSKLVVKNYTENEIAVTINKNFPNIKKNETIFLEKGAEYTIYTKKYYISIEIRNKNNIVYDKDFHHTGVDIIVYPTYYVLSSSYATNIQYLVNT